jgi:hypothetical protein
MAAMAGASGARSWLQNQTWLTPERLRRATIAMFVAAFGFSSVGLSGSSPARHVASAHMTKTHAAQAR